MKIFDIEYYFFRSLRYIRYHIRKRKRRRGYLLPPKLAKYLTYCLALFVAVVLLIVTFKKLEKTVVEEDILVEEVETTPVNTTPIPKPIPDASPAPLGSSKAIGIKDIDSGVWIFEFNTDELRPPASITKLLTAIVATENYSLEDTVSVPSLCTTLAGNQVGLVAGEVWTVEELMYGMLVLSASDATCALSSYVAQVTDYVAAMNLRASSLGLENTNFVNPIGLDDEGHLSTAKDLIMLGEYALGDETIRRIIATPVIEIQGRILENTNELLGEVDGMIGIKTGYTEEAGECLLFAVSRDDRNIIGVVMGSEDRFSDSSALIEWVFATHEWVID